MNGQQTFARIALCATVVWPSLWACGGGQNSGSAPAVASGPAGAAATIENRAGATDPPALDSTADARAEVRTRLAMTVPSGPQPRPPELLLSLTMPAPDRDLAALLGYLDAIQPGVSGALPFATPDAALTFLTGSGLSGLDPSQPIFALLVSPRQYPDSWMLIGTAASKTSVAAQRKDAAVFYHGGRVAIGDVAVLERFGPYAFSTLLAQPMASELTATAHTDALRSYFKDQIDPALAILDQQAASDPSVADTARFARSLVSLIEQSDRLDMRLSAQGSSATATFELVPKPDSQFAALVHGQTPASYSLVGEAPPGPIVIAGHTTSKALSDAMASMQENRVSPLLDPDLQKELERHGEVFRDAVQGEFALSMAFVKDRGAHLSGVFETSDNKAVVGAFTAMNNVLVKVLKRHVPTLTPRRRTFKHKRIKLTEMLYPMPKNLPADVRQVVDTLAGRAGVAMIVGGARQRALLAIGKNARTQAKRMLDGALTDRTAAPAPGIASVLADARQRKETFFMAFDVQTVLADLGLGQAPAGGGDWFVMGVCFVRDSIAYRITVPAGAARAAIAQAANL